MGIHELTGDSQLVVKQMNGEYRVNLLPYRDKALKLMGLFDSITLNHVGRTGNDRADVLATLASRLVMPDGKIYNSIRIIRRDHPSRFEVGSSSANSQRLSTNAEVETKTAGSGGSFSQYPISLRFSVLHAFQKRDFLVLPLSTSLVPRISRALDRPVHWNGSVPISSNILICSKKSCSETPLFMLMLLMGLLMLNNG